VGLFRDILKLKLFGNKYKKEADRIGTAIHEQIFDAMKVDEKSAGANLKSAFFCGYMFGFVKAGFIAQGLSGDQADEQVNANMQYICDGVIPGRLWETFSSQLKYMESVKQLLELDENPDMDEGGAAGLWDGSNLITSGTRASRTNLKSYLLGEKLDYLEPKT
jgi:hypothetical protein